MWPRPVFVEYAILSKCRLINDALARIRLQLETIAKGIKPRPIVVGSLSQNQLQAINEHRAKNGFNPIVADILFNGYTIDEVIEQLVSAFSPTSNLVLGRSTVFASSVPRIDRQGRSIRDEIVFECTARHPHPELYSVVPRGDGKKSSQNEEGHPFEWPSFKELRSYARVAC